MFKYSFLFALIFLSINSLVFGQKKVIDHTVYNEWKSLKNQKTSMWGNLISFEIAPHRGDGMLYLHTTKTEEKKQFPRGSKAMFTEKEDVFIYSIHPGHDTLRALELKKVKKDKWVKDSLGIYWIAQDSLVKIPNLVDFKMGENGKYLAYTILQDSLVSKEEPKKKKRKKKKKEEEEPTSKGNTLFLLNLETHEIESIKNVTAFHLNKQGDQLFYVTHLEKKKKDEYTVHLFNLNEKRPKSYEATFTDVGPMTFGKANHLSTFIASQDSTKETKSYQLYLWGFTEENPTLIIDTTHNNITEGMMPSQHSRLRFSKSGEKLFFGLSEIPRKKEEDTLLKREKATLDLWHYQDKKLQPQQLAELKREEKKNFLSVFHLNDNSFIQLANDTLSVSLLNHGNTIYALGQSSEPYQAAYNWTYPWARDYYRVHLETGNAELIQEKVGYSVGLSPNGNYFVYFNSLENQFYSIDVDSHIQKCMTCPQDINWKQDINGMPHSAGPEGSPGYTQENEILLYSEFDIWTYNFETHDLTSLTSQMGEKNNTKFRLIKLEKDSTYIDLKKSIVHATDQTTFDEEVWTYHNDSLTKRYRTNHMLQSFILSKEGEALIFRQMNTKDYPDLFLTDMNFETVKRLSEANPQQKEYLWTTVEMIDWESYNGEKLRGLVYKPEDFDSTKSYPLLVYFYETYTEMKNRHYIPRPTASIIFATEYASAGYVVFIPDIRYEEGYPGKSAYNSIMSGTDKVLELYPNIDSTRMGLQGQSWGGYQTAQLITMTNRYAAAMAGAPVSNMFSAYGGIRWTSGLNRMFQYEYTQSRIGKTIWEAPELYVENSPLFGVPNIETPLLIMHNDEDGAVPWYQGIELFTTMKRLQKPVWMLNYNGDGHNLMKNANRMDLSIRMRQFFDYYLQGKEAPEWLIHGIPATKKGKTYRLDPITK